MGQNRDITERRRMNDFVARHKRWLVEQGDSIGNQAKANAEWGSQARSIWEAARQETEPLVLLNLLRYQSARNKNWRNPEDVATPLEAAINECINRSEQQPELALELVRHLLVYTIRAYTWASKDARRKKEVNS